MASSRRPPRRQGVVYGPAQYDRGSESASLVGRILGMLVVAGAIGVLVVGALTFTRGGGPVDVPATPTGVSLASDPPAPTEAPTEAVTTPAAETIAPTAPPSEAPMESPLESPAASPFELEVREGPGSVAFGTEANSRLIITDPRTSFDLNERITWSAYLTEPAASADLRVTISTYDPATGAEELLREEEVRPRVASAQRFLRRLRADRALDGPGIYVIRYLRDEDVMAEGFFEVTE